jgi:hypothetical protein
MDIRAALTTAEPSRSACSPLGALQFGLILAMTPGRGSPSAGWVPMPGPPDGSVMSPAPMDVRTGRHELALPAQADLRADQGVPPSPRRAPSCPARDPSSSSWPRPTCVR